MVFTYSDNKFIYSVDMMFAYIGLKKTKYVKKKIKDLIKNLDYKCWGKIDKNQRYSPLDVLENPKKYKNDFKRIKDANLDYPIIMHGNYVVDGMHRLTKAYLKKKKDIKVYMFDTKLMHKFTIAKIGQWDKIDKVQLYEYIMMFYNRFCLSKSSP